MLIMSINSSKGVLDYIFPKNPVTHNREIRLVPSSVERTIGSYLYPSMIDSQGGYYSKHGYDTLVEKVGKRLAEQSDRSHLHFQFNVIDSSKVNAWALPGGKIAFYRGLIQKMDAEKDTFGIGSFTLEEKLAAVGGHEIVHACARHSAKGLEFTMVLYILLSGLQYTIGIFIQNKQKELENQKESGQKPLMNHEQQLAIAQMVNLAFHKAYNTIFNLLQCHNTRQHEFEADRYGMVYLKRAGYDPKAAIWLQKFFAKQHPSEGTFLEKLLHLFSTHPTSEERLKENEKTLEMIEQGQLQ
jgi:beta-barrel assembly-enhancing protease